ncbi:MAG: hypothetical protein JWL76_163 [Thermoleophilia bacterium]|nr:hypothetical protein [Thermoleophilia bacterium]
MPRHAPRTQARRTEAGFTMLEMMIVVIIMAILALALMKAFGGAKKGAYANEGKTVGSSYMQAISQYHADFANHHPNAAAWSGSSPAATAERGPLNLTAQPYMKNIPEGVSAGRVGVSVNVAANCGTGAAPSAPAGAGAQTSWVAVCYMTEPRFFIKVYSHKASGAPWDAANGGAVCFMGATTAAPKC